MYGSSRLRKANAEVIVWRKRAWPVQTGRSFQIQGKARTGKKKANPIIAETSGAELKVWHEKPIPDAHGIIDNDLARDNLENDIPFADLQDL